MTLRISAAYALPLALLLGLIVVDSAGLTSDPDTFWHLRTGRSVLETHTTLPVDIFSYSYAGRPWHYKDLVADVFMYAGFAVLGYRWLLALKVAAVAVIAFACHAIVRPRDRQPLVLLLCAGLVIDSFWPSERPNLFAIALFAVALALIERARRTCEETDARRIARALAPIVLVNVVWSSLHPFAVLGYLLAFGFAGTLLVARFAPDAPVTRSLFGPRPSRPFVRGSLLAAVASPILGLVNPSGVYIWRGVFAVGGNAEIRHQVLEWRRLSLGELLASFPTATVTIAIASVAVAARVVAAVRARERDSPRGAGQLAALIALGARAESSGRWLPYATIAAPLYLAMLLSDALARRAVKLPRGSTVLAGVLLLVLLRVRQGDSPVAIGEDPSWSPRSAVAFAAEHDLRGAGRQLDGARRVRRCSRHGPTCASSWTDAASTTPTMSFAASTPSTMPSSSPRCAPTARRGRWP